MQDKLYVDVVAGGSGGAAFEDFFAGTFLSDILSMKNYGRAVFTMLMEHGATGTTLVTVVACDDVSASNTEAIVFRYKKVSTIDTQGDVTAATVAGFTSAAGADKMYIVEVDADDLPDGYDFVRLSCVEAVDSPIDGSVTGILCDPRYTALPSAKA